MGLTDALQMMSMMGGGDELVGQAIPQMDMMARMQGLPHINPTQYAQGYEIRRALRQGLQPAHMAAGMRGPRGGPAQGLPGLGGGMDPSSMTDPGPANATLAPYGLQMPTHTNPFLFFQDQNAQGEPTWAGRHPKVARAIEGAMIGATTSGEGVTTGDSISNVAKSVLGIPGLYRQSQAAQMQAPFDMARNLAAVQADQAAVQSHLATAFHAYATGQAALDKPDPVKPKQLYVGPQGEPYSFDTGTGGLSPAVGGPASITKPGTPKSAGAGKLPPYVKTAADRLSYYDAIEEGRRKDPNFDPSVYDAKPPEGWSSRVVRTTSKLSGVSAGAGASARKAVDTQYGNLSDTQKKELEPFMNDIRAAEQGLSSVTKMRPSQLADYPGNTPAEQRANAQKAAQDKLDTAKRAHQQKLDSYKTPQYDSAGNRK